ncbi:MAG: hypothetical protein WKF59_06540 [Chitinophagaceae bacterium]
MWDAKPTTLPPDAKYSAAIVLGGYSSEDAQNDGYFNIAADRFIEAIKLKQKERVTTCLYQAVVENCIQQISEKVTGS